MKLCFLIYHYFPHGGQQRDFLRIAATCLARGYQVRVYTLRWEGDIPAGFDVRVVDVSAMSRHRLYARFHEAVRDRLSAEPADAVVGFTRMPGLDVYFAADTCYAEKAWTERGLLYRLTPRYRHFLASERAVFGPDSSTRVLLISELQRDGYLRHYPYARPRMVMLPPGISPRRRPPADAQTIRREWRRAFNISEGERVILQVGSGYRTKGVDRSLRAVAALPAALRASVRYVLVGRGRVEPFRRLAARLGIAHQCLFAGPRDDVQRFLLGADLMLHPAYRESAGHAILEGVINGLPVLTTASCGYAIHVERADCGLVSPSPFRQHTLNGQLAEMLQSTALSRWRHNGLRYGATAQLYSLPECAAVHIEEAAAQQRSSAGRVFLREDIAAAWQGADPFRQVATVQGRIYRDVRGRRTLQFSLRDRQYFLKHHTGVGWAEIIRHLLQLRLPVLGAANEWRAVRLLQGLGIDTLQIAAQAQRGRNPARRESFLITDALSNTVSLEAVCADWIQSPPRIRFKRRLIAEVARISRVMHQGGICHRDYYLCHFLLHCDERGRVDEHARPRLSLIDLHRALINPRNASRWVEKDLAALYFSARPAALTRRDLLRFLRSYSQRPLRDILADEAERWQRVARRAGRMARREIRRQQRSNREWLVPPPGSLPRRWRTLPPEEALDLLRRLVLGLANCHRHGWRPVDRALSGIHEQGNRMAPDLTGARPLDAAARNGDGPEEAALDNLAEFLSWFPLEAESALEGLEAWYCQCRGFTAPAHGSTLLPRVIEARQRHWRRQRASLFRSTAQLTRRQSLTRFVIGKRFMDSAALEAFVAEPDAHMKKGTLLKDGDSTTVVVLRMGGTDCIIKRYNLLGSLHALRRLPQPSRAWSHWRHGHALMALGAHTPEPLLVIERRLGPLRRQAWLVMEALPGHDLLRATGQLADETDRQRIMEQFRDWFALMARYRVNHGDMKISNFISSPAGLAVLDLDGMSHPRSEFRFRRGFARDIERFLRNWRNEPGMREAAEDMIQQLERKTD